VQCPKQEFIRDKKHLKWIRELPCVICGEMGCDAAHIRINSHAGGGRKPADNRVLPLCSYRSPEDIGCHRKQHNTSEVKFYYPFGGWERAVILAKSLYEVTGDTSKALELIRRFRNGY